MSSLTVERLSPGEGDRLRAVRLAALLDSPQAFATTCEQSKDRPLESWSKAIIDLATFVVSDGAQDVGMVRGVGLDSTQVGDGVKTAILLSMWVAPVARSTGAARYLVSRLIDWARDENFERLVLDVHDANGRAIAFYDKCGFRPTGEKDAPDEHRCALDLTTAPRHC